MTKRYVALGSSMAAGPGIPPRAKDAPWRAGRSAANYPHLVAQRLGLDLVDVTYSGATTAHVLTDRQNNARARVLFVDYLTLLPPPGRAAPPLPDVDVALGRRIADTLERLTSEAAATTGCELVRAAEASRAHHAWSAEPWTTKPTKFGVPVPGRPVPVHPNAAGMRAVADLVATQVS